MFTEHLSPSAQALAFQHLQRLSQKPGVHSTLILSRATGAIVHSTGLPSLNDIKKTQGSAQSETNGQNARESGARPGQNDRGDKDADSRAADATSRIKTAEEVAGMVMRLFGAAGNFAQGMVEEGLGEGDEEDVANEIQEDVKLIRLRLRRREVVVVPDAKFILVVIHDPHIGQN